MNKETSFENQEMSYGSDYYGFIPALSMGSGVGTEVKPDLYCYTVQIVNICLAGDPASNKFVLIDAGMPGKAKEIIDVTQERFGKNSRPECILLTHGHFDHVGAIIELLEHWEGIPVYAHELELPFLTGKMRYPDPDPTVEGGLIAKMSPIFPNEPINLGDRVRVLPADGSVPAMPGYRWIHTPGHSPGHVSFFREEDRTLIAGDAFVSVKQDSLYKVFTQDTEINGPPRYFTPDWAAAKNSVKTLEALKPAVAVTGHGLPVKGDQLSEGLRILAEKFDQLALPDYGKYVNGAKH